MGFVRSITRQAAIRLKKDPEFALRVFMPGMKLPPHQLDMLKGMWRAVYSYASCGRSTGKTAFTGIFLLLWCATHPSTQALTLGLKFKTGQLMFLFMDQMLKKYPELGKCIRLTNSKAFMRRDNSEWAIEFKNNSRIATIPSDLNRKGERVRGYRASILVIDEIAAIPQEIVRQVFLPCASVTDPDGFRKVIKLTTGGYRPSQAWDDVRLHYKEAKAGNPDFYFANYCYLDVPPEFSYIIDGKAIRDIEETSSPEEAARELYGKWTAAGGNYYSPMMIERNRLMAIEHEVVPERVGVTDGVYVLGVDPAGCGGDETAIAVLKQLDDTHWGLVESYAFNYKTGWAQKNAELVLDLISRFNPAYIAIDKNGGEQLVQELKRHYQDNPEDCPIPIDAEPGEIGRLIVRVYVPTGTGRDNNTRLNSRLLRALDGNGHPELFIPGAEDEESEDLKEIDKLCVQLINVQADDSNSTPGLKKFTSSMRKDRYSALLYAFNCAEELISGVGDYEACEGSSPTGFGNCIAISLN